MLRGRILESNVMMANDSHTNRGSLGLGFSTKANVCIEWSMLLHIVKVYYKQFLVVIKKSFVYDIVSY